MGFAACDTETAALRAAFEDFERAGARGMDRRHALERRRPVNYAQPTVRQHGAIVLTFIRHNDVRLPDGTRVPMRQDIDFDGTAVSFQRPLVVLIGPASISRAESFAGPMQAYRCAILVGEQTTGACGVVRTVHPAPGGMICLATHHTDFGPDAWQLNRIGVTPDVVVAPVPEDEAAGCDPNSRRRCACCGPSQEAALHGPFAFAAVGTRGQPISSLRPCRLGRNRGNLPPSDGSSPSWRSARRSGLHFSLTRAPPGRR